MTTNARHKRMGLDGGLAGIGVAKYDLNPLANILGFSHMTNKYRIQYECVIHSIQLNYVQKFDTKGTVRAIE